MRNILFWTLLILGIAVAGPTRDSFTLQAAPALTSQVQEPQPSQPAQQNEPAQPSQPAQTSPQPPAPQTPREQIDVNVNQPQQEAPTWYRSPTWIAIGSLAVVLLAVIIILMARGSTPTTIVRSER